jgi:hypothetical protein
VNGSDGGSFHKKQSAVSTDGVIPVGSDISAQPNNPKKKAMRDVIITNSSSNNEYDEAADKQR